MEPEDETMSLQVFTDGASSPDGRGGWAYVVVEDDNEILRGQGSALGVTHQRMEIRAVAEALLAAPKSVPVKVVGDSAYVIDCFLKKVARQMGEQRLEELLEKAGRKPRRVGAPFRGLAGTRGQDEMEANQGARRKSVERNR